MSGREHVEILSPIGETESASSAPREIPSRENRHTIGVIDNAKPNADLVLGAIAEGLIKADSFDEIKTLRKRNEASPAEAEELGGLANRVQLAVGGLAE